MKILYLYIRVESVDNIRDIRVFAFPLGTCYRIKLHSKLRRGLKPVVGFSCGCRLGADMRCGVFIDPLKVYCYPTSDFLSSFFRALSAVVVDSSM